jgi:hypothetical protein
MFSGYGCAGLCGPRTRWEEAEIGRTASIYSEKSEVGSTGGGGGAETLPWAWKECTLLRVLEAYEFCLTLRAPRTTQTTTAGQHSEGGFEGIEKVFAAVGLGGATQPQPARRGMLSRELFESPSLKEGQSRRSSQVVGHGLVTASPPEAHLHEGKTTEGGKDLPYPFAGFGSRDSSEKEQIPFPPSPGLIEGEGEEHDDEEEVEGGDIVVRVEDEVEEEEDEEEEEEEETRRRTSEDPSSFSGRASNSLSSLGQPIPSRYPFAFRHPARGGSMSSTGSPPFAFSRATATPQSKSTSTRESHETRSTGNAESAPSSPSGGSPVSAAAPSSSVSSPQEHAGGGMPMPPRHPAAGTTTRQRAGSVPVSPTPAGGGLTATRPPPSSRQQAFEEHHHHRRHLRASIVSSDPLPESDREEDRPPRSGQPSPDGSLEAREREDSVGLLSPPSSQPSPRASLLGSRNGSAASLARIGSAFRSRSRSRHTSSGSGGTGSGSGASSRHNSHVSAASVSLAPRRTRAQSLIHSISGASRSSIELVLGRTPGSPGAVRLSGGESSASASDGALSNPENHTFGVPGVGTGDGSLRRAGGARARTLESDAGRSSVSSSSAAAAAVAAAVSARVTARAEGQVQQEESRSGRAAARARSTSSSSSEQAQLQTARSFTSQTSPLSLLSQSVQSEDTTSGSTRTQTRTITQAQSQTQTRQHSPEGGLPIPLPQTHVSVIPPSPPPPPAADLSTAATSLVTMPPTIVSQSTESSGRTPTSPSGMEHYAPPHTRTFTTPH